MLPDIAWTLPVNRLPLTALLALSLPDVLPIFRPRHRQIILVILRTLPTRRRAG